MEVHLNPETQARLDQLASDRGSDAELLAREAIERLVDHGEWFIREVEKGIASADRGDFVGHEEVGKRLERLLAEKQFVA